MTPDEIIDLMEAADPLCDLPRTGWLLRGVPAPESLAAHSWAVALVAMCLADQLRDEGQRVDIERVLRLALLHDLAESRTGDIPMPSKTPAVRRAIHEMEAAAIGEMLPEGYAGLWAEAEAGESLEARVVQAADKLQMMIKVLIYEERRGAELSEFWQHPGNFRDMGLDGAKALFAAIRARARGGPDRGGDAR